MGTICCKDKTHTKKRIIHHRQTSSVGLPSHTTLNPSNITKYSSEVVPRLKGTYPTKVI